MLEKNPENRISSFEALSHPAFTIVLSQSPLSVRNVFDNKELLKFNHLTEKNDTKIRASKKGINQFFSGIPDKIEDMSPKPSSKGHKLSKSPHSKPISIPKNKSPSNKYSPSPVKNLMKTSPIRKK